MQSIDDYVVHEFLGGHLRQRQRERQHQECVDPQLGNQFRPAPKGGEQGGMTARPDDLRWMRIKVISTTGRPNDRPVFTTSRISA